MQNDKIFHIGIDFDMVINNWEAPGSPFLRLWNEFFGSEMPYIPSTEAKSWEVSHNYPLDTREKIRSIYVNPKPGFYTDMPLMEGALEGIEKLRSLGHRLYIVTIPIMEVSYELPHFFENSLDIRTRTWTRVVMEKKFYLLKHFGQNAPPLFPTEHKFMFAGDILIDDNPYVVTRAQKKPTWQHILFDRGYAFNKDVPIGTMKGDWKYVVQKIQELSSRTSVYEQH